MRKLQRKTPDIIEIIKDLLSLKKGELKVFDKDVANALNITQAKLAICKTRNIIPYKEVISFCAINDVNADNMFYIQG